MVYQNTVIAGHRGYKEAYPENTILSYDAAVDAGADVIELDLHITTDDKIIMAHDVNTLRVFGEDYEVNKEAYEPTLSKLRTLREPHLPPPLFSEVLTWLQKKSADLGKEGETRNIKLMLDIKRDNDPEKLLKLILQDLESVDPDLKYWKNKLVFGIWASEFYLNDLKKHGFSTGIIAFDFTIAHKVYQEVIAKGGVIDFISMNYLLNYHKYMVKDFAKFTKEKNMDVWLWTVNKRQELAKAQAIFGKNLVGIITDDPSVFTKANESKPENISVGYRLNLFVKKHFYSWLMHFMHNGYNVSPAFMFLKKVGFI